MLSLITKNIKSIVLDLILKKKVLSAVNHRFWSEIIQFKFVIGP